jgi:transcriptional regulator with XRE-family HTH domain
MVFTENLRQLRHEQYFSQAGLARRAGLHALTITRLEGGTTAPSTRTVRAFAAALRVEPSELATPNEVAELRRAVERVGVAPRLDHRADDGGAAQPEQRGQVDCAGGRAAQAIADHQDVAS